MADEIIPYEQISEIDIDDLLDRKSEDVRAHFQGVADKATAGQLRLFLDLLDRGGDDEEDKPLLARSFVERRMAVFSRMKAMRLA